MADLLKSVPDVTTFAANVVVFLAAIGAAVVGALTAVKKIKEAFIDSAGKAALPVQTQVIGGILQDAYGSVVLAESIRDLRECIKENTSEVRESRHTMERLLDRIK